MIAVIGSVALRKWIDVPRKSADLDIIGSYNDCIYFARHYFLRITQSYPISGGNKQIFKGFDTDNKPAILECEIAWPGSHTERLLQAISTDIGTRTVTIAEYEVMFPSLHMLYMIKMSHRYLKNSKHFYKTMCDIRLMRSKGAKILPEHEQLYLERQKETYEYKHPNLNVDKDQFFDKSESFYVYDHDSIHLAVMHLDKPAYTFFKPDDKQVYCDREMFEQCPLSIQLMAVLEECYVLALERSQIPHGETVDRQRSFDIALEKVCTSITSGWFREFAWENYDVIKLLYNSNYVDLFYDAVDNDRVPLFYKQAA